MLLPLLQCDKKIRQNTTHYFTITLYERGTSEVEYATKAYLISEAKHRVNVILSFFLVMIS